jgi:hypothetical protein
MDAKKVLPLLKYCRRHLEQSGFRTAETDALIAEAEHEAQTRGWSPGSEPPSGDAPHRMILLLEKPNQIVYHGYLSAREDEIAYCFVSDGFRGVAADRVLWQDLPPLPEMAARKAAGS